MADEPAAETPAPLDAPNPAARVAAFLTNKGAKAVCPFCDTNNWTLVDAFSRPTVLMTADLKGWETYALACENCGFVRTHLRKTVDREGSADG